jgi:uncharacterized membrane protein
MITMLSTAYFVIDPRYHYVAIPLTIAALAMVEGVSRIRVRHVRTALGVIIIVLALVSARADGLSPGGNEYRSGLWPLSDNPRSELLEEAISIPGDRDSVATTWNLTPHMSHREKIYTYPTPWRSMNWGIAGEDPDDPAGVEWLVLDLSKVGVEDTRTYEDLVASGEFRLVYDEEQVVVAQRVRSPDGQQP